MISLRIHYLKNLLLKVTIVIFHLLIQQKMPNQKIQNWQQNLKMIKNITIKKVAVMLYKQELNIE